MTRQTLKISKFHGRSDNPARIQIAGAPIALLLLRIRKRSPMHNTVCANAFDSCAPI
ncbi:MAG: hypothetical protein ACRECP_06120 [Methylocella sp.]